MVDTTPSIRGIFHNMSLIAVNLGFDVASGPVAE
jgi:hypothetical protein